VITNGTADSDCNTGWPLIVALRAISSTMLLAASTMNAAATTRCSRRTIAELISGVCGHSHSRQLAAPMPAASATRSTTVAAISMPFVCGLY
jgi:hypothetical protein